MVRAKRTTPCKKSPSKSEELVVTPQKSEDDDEPVVKASRLINVISNATVLAAEERCAGLIRDDRRNVLWIEESLKRKDYLKDVDNEVAVAVPEQAREPKVPKSMRTFGALTASWVTFVYDQDPVTWTPELLTRMRLCDKQLCKVIALELLNVSAAHEVREGMDEVDFADWVCETLVATAPKAFHYSSLLKKPS